MKFSKGMRLPFFCLLISATRDQSRWSPLIQNLRPAILYCFALLQEDLQPPENARPAAEAPRYFGMRGQSAVLMFDESSLIYRLQLPTNGGLLLGSPTRDPRLHEQIRRIDLNKFAARFKGVAFAIDPGAPPASSST